MRFTSPRIFVGLKYFIVHLKNGFVNTTIICPTSRPSTLKSCIASHHLLQLCTFYGLLCVGSHMPPFYCSAPQPEQYIVPKCTDGACFVSFVVFQSFLQVPHFCRLASLKGDKLRPCWGNNCIVVCIPSKCDIDDCVGKDHWKGFDIAL